jgi:hypothetical protein
MVTGVEVLRVTGGETQGDGKKAQGDGMGSAHGDERGTEIPDFVFLCYNSVQDNVRIKDASSKFNRS